MLVIKNKITKHAKKRIKERIDLTGKKKVSNLFSRAMTKGYNKENFVEGSFKEYLEYQEKKQKYTQIKIYDGYLYVHRNRTLITVYKVPSKFNNIEEYLIPKVKIKYLKEILRKKMNVDRLIFRTVSSKYNIENLEVVFLEYNRITLSYGVGKTAVEAMSDALSKYVEKGKK